MADTLRLCQCGSELPAQGRCERCVKPVCEECRIERGGHLYCSHDCANVSEQFDSMEDELKDARRKRRGGLGSKLAGLVVTLVVFYLIWWLAFDGPGPNRLLALVGL